MGDRRPDQTARVRAGYNVASRAYRADTADEDTQRQYAEWLGEVRDRAPSGGDVLDLGCGNGIPAAKWLSDNGFRVTGVESDWLGGGAEMWWSHPGAATFGPGSSRPDS